MPYDWSKIEREQEQQTARNLRPLAFTWIAIGLVGSVVALLTGHSEKLVGLIGWFVIGLVFYLGSRRHLTEQHHPGKSPEVKASPDD